jgi:hypothetical protein
MANPNDLNLISNVTEVYIASDGTILEPIVGSSIFHAQSNYANLLSVYIEDGTASDTTTLINFTPTNSFTGKVPSYTSHWFFMNYEGIDQKTIDGVTRSFAHFYIKVPNIVLRYNKGAQQVQNIVTVIQRYGSNYIGDFATAIELEEQFPAAENENNLATAYVLEDNGFFQVSDGEWVEVQQINAALQTKQYNTFNINIQSGLSGTLDVTPIETLAAQMIMNAVSNVEESYVKTNTALSGHINNTANPHFTTIENLNDTTITSISNGNILRFNGTDWVNSSDLNTAETDIVNLENRMDTVESDIDGLENKTDDIIEGNVDIDYDNSVSELTATTVKGAIDENNALIDTLRTDLTDLDNTKVEKNPATITTLNQQDKVYVNDGNEKLTTILDLKNFIVNDLVAFGFVEFFEKDENGQPVLPEGRTKETNKIYLFNPDNSDVPNDQFEEWIYRDDTDNFEKIGTTQIALDNYYNITQVNALLDQKVTKTGDVMTGTLEVPDLIIDGKNIAFNDVDGTFDFELSEDVTLQLGQEVHFYGKASNAITNGQAVMFNGVQGDHILMTPSVAATLQTQQELFIGIATSDIAQGEFGYVTWFGYVRGIDTGGLGYTVGQILYVNTNDGATAGSLTATKPASNKGIIQVAAVVKEETGDANNGILLVRPKFISRTISDIAGLQSELDTIGNHIDDTTIHFTQENISITESQISDFGSYEPANSNIQTHIGTTTGNPHNVTKTDVGLGNVTNDAQIPLTQKGVADGVATLNSSGKLVTTQIPDYLVGGLKLVGTFTRLGAATNPLGLADFITGSYATNDYTVSTQLDTFTGLAYGNDDYDGVGQNYIGSYWIATENLTLQDAGTLDEASWNTAVFDDGVVPNAGTSLQPLSVEAGDWLVITGWDNVNKVFKFSVINNTYSNATTETFGVSRLSDATDTSALSGNDVVTEGVLNSLIGSTGTANKLASAAHTHVKADITDFAHNHDDLYYTETELNNGQLDNRYYTETELNNGQLDTRYYTETEIDNILLNDTNTTHTQTESIKSVPVGTIDGQVSGFEAEGLTLENSVVNGDFSDGTTGWNPTGFTLSVSNNILTGTTTGGSQFSSVVQNNVFALNNKFFVHIRLRDTSGNSTQLVISEQVTSNAIEIFNPVQNQWYTLSGILNTTQVNGNLFIGNFGTSTNLEVDGNAGVFAINMTALGIASYTEAQMLDLVRSGYFDGLTSVEQPSITSVGKNLIDLNDTTTNFYVDYTTGNLFSNVNYVVTNFIRIKGATTYYFTNANLNIAFYDSSFNYISTTLGVGSDLSFSKLSPDNAQYVRVSILKVNISNGVQLEQGSTATAYEPYKSSTLALNTPLRSLPNGVRDRVYEQNGEVWLEKRIQEYVLKASDIFTLENRTNTQRPAIQIPSDGLWISLLSEYVNVEGFISGQNGDDVSTNIRTIWPRASFSGELWLTFAPNTYADLAAAQTALAGTVIQYQLATPQLINLTQQGLADGQLTAYANGTVYNTSDTFHADINFDVASNRSAQISALIDNSDYQAKLIDSKASKVQEDWIEPTLLNGWVNVSTTRTSRYYKDDMGVVHIVLNTKDGTATAGTLLFNLPLNYRPTESTKGVGVRFNDGTLSYITISSAGAVEIGVNNGSGSFEFHADFKVGE